MAVDATGRSRNRLNNKFAKIEGPFAPRTIEMLESPAYRALSLSAHRVLARIEIELGQRAMKENGSLIVTHRQFEKYGIHRNGVSAAVREACNLGFLAITRQGYAGSGEHRLASTYRLTFRPTEDAKATNEWRRIESVEQAEKIAGAARSARKKKISARGKHGGTARGKHGGKANSPLVETTSTGHPLKPRVLSIYRDGPANLKAVPSDGGETPAA